MENGFTFSFLRFVFLGLFLPTLDTEAQNKVLGAVGSSILLDPGVEADFDNSNVLWEFTADSKDPVTILDHNPNRHTWKSNDQFKSRLSFNRANGSLTLNSVKPTDQGVYTISVNAAVIKRIKLVVFGKMEAYMAPGSSIFFPGVFENRRGVPLLFQWQVDNGNKTGVLHYHAQAKKPSIMNKFKGRLDFFSSNGSFVLHNLTSSDEGLYTLSVDMRDIVQIVRLRIMDELLNASILSNSSSLDSTIALTCDVSGKPHTYQWQKDGGEISQHHQLINENRSLIIWNAQKNDSGTYTCIARNPVSSIRTHYTLTICGDSFKQTVIINASITGLILSSLHFTLLILQFCLITENPVRKSCQALQKYVTLLFQILLSIEILTLIAIAIALNFHILIKGLTSVNVLIILVMISILLVLAVTPTFSRKRTDVQSPLGISNIVSSLLMIAISIAIMTDAIQQDNQRCEPAANLQTNIIHTIVLSYVFFSIILPVSFKCTEKDKRGKNKNENADHSERELNKPFLNSQSTISIEEKPGERAD